jgi:hypothetical protein
MLPPMVSLFARVHVSAAIAIATAASCVVALSGCTSSGPSSPGGGGTVRTTLGPVDAQVAGEALARETRLQQQVAADVTAFGHKVSALKPVATALAVHVTALQDAVGSPDPLTLAPAPAAAANPHAALQRAKSGLAGSARKSAAEVVDTDQAISPDLAAVLASVGASDAAVLTALGGPVVVAHQGAPTSSGDAALLSSLQSTLAGEQAAVYGYGVVGGQLAANSAGPTAHAQALAGQSAHATQRDVLVGVIADAGGAANPAAAGYDLPFPVKTAKAARRLATSIEDGCAGQYAAVIAAAADPKARGLPLSWLFDAAHRHLVWAGSAPALPGLLPPAATS